MAVSGSTDYVVTRNNIIYDALWLINALGENETPSNEMINRCSRVLNNMIKAWQADGLNLWTITEGIIFPIEGQVTYTIDGSTATSAMTYKAKTTLISDAGAAAVTLIGDDTTGMTAADKITITLDDGTVHTTTISSVDSTTQLTISSGLASAAASGQYVVAYTSTMLRPNEILSVRWMNDSGRERPLFQLNKQQYYNIPNKLQTGTPTSFYYDPQMDNGIFHCWLAPSSSKGLFMVTHVREVDDFDAANDNPDFPVEWSEALTYGLAMRIGSAYGRQDLVNSTIGPMAQAFYETLLSSDNEKNNMSIMLDEDFNGDTV